MRGAGVGVRYFLPPIKDTFVGEGVKSPQLPTSPVSRALAIVSLERDRELIFYFFDKKIDFIKCIFKLAHTINSYILAP